MFYLCLTIFFARLIDVSLGTIRTVYTIKEQNVKAGIIGFIEISIWFLVVKEALNTDNNSIFIVLAYSLGYSIGTFIGGYISSKINKSRLIIQIITNRNISSLRQKLRNNKFSVTTINSEGINPNYILFLEIPSSKLSIVKRIIYQHDSKAFIIVNEAKQVFNGYFGI